MTRAIGPLPDMGRVAMAVPSPGGDPVRWVVTRRQEDAGSRTNRPGGADGHGPRPAGRG
jgi:hypothetical protein